MKTLVIIPTYNERENAPKLAMAVFKIIPETDILVVDDNSPDKTAVEIKKLQPAHPNLMLLERPKKEGLGKAYAAAFHKALADKKYDAVITMDADFSHNPKYLPEMIKEAASHDLVIGSRYIKNGGVAKEWEIWRKFLSSFANTYLKIILGAEINDWTGGFNLIKLNKLAEINLEDLCPEGYAFQFSTKYQLLKKGAKTKEVPIVFEEREKGRSKMSRKIILEAVFMPWKIRFKEILG